MKMTSNQRIGAGLFLALISLAAIYLAVSQSGPVIVAPAPVVADTVAPAAELPAEKPARKPAKPAQTKPAPPQRRHLDETF